MSLSKFQSMRRLAIGLLLLPTAVALSLVGAAGGNEHHDRVEGLGLSLIVIGIAGRLWCTLYIGNRKSACIVDAGPYSLVRNPLYVFSALAVAGAAAQSGSVLLSILGGAATLTIFFFVALREEAFLAEKFGPSYLAYKERTPRFLPNFCAYRDSGTVLAAPERLFATLRDGMAFFLAKPAFDIIGHLQTSGALPIMLKLF